MQRRKLLVVGATACGTILAGCSSSEDDEEPSPVDGDDTENSNGNEKSDGGDNTAEETEAEDTEKVIGALVDGDQMHLVVEDVAHRTELGGFFEADEGNEFVVISLAMKNVSDGFLEVSNLLQASLRDSKDSSYNRTFVGGKEPTFNDGQFVPGEVGRGIIVFEVPEDASGLELQFDFDVSAFGDVNQAHIDLELETNVHTLEQDLQVEIYSAGQEIEYGGTEVAINSVEFEDNLGRFAKPDPGNEYAVIDISITNETGEEQRVSTLLQMLVKDKKGYSYQEDWAATTELDQEFDESSPIEDGETRRGKVVYQVEEDLSPLYWVFEFNMWINGDKSFWQLR
ncbi:DUF4352 domain-containing protein [Natronosalvus rutilus]|uniref:DUF4352 domain-containing protein n=1 Tax=Natronosalvus rutilus TaxID=2953753 RepID=A0A9E7NFP0_9EURY|nr:DUF4352 domain-containing protein [Natronosalvus rutilus]UTF55912.1 DUF4352 domain-containing protein [Natronosalvus rutilus]